VQPELIEREPMPNRELRISASDSDKNGVSDTVIFEFYEDDEIVNGAVTFDKNEDGSIEGGHSSTDVDSDGDVDADDQKILLEIASLFLKTKWADTESV
jgi:hypothetical protein